MSEFAMLAHHYSGENVLGWYASRKLNGWRMIWIPYTKGMSLNNTPFVTQPLSGLASGLWTLGRYSGPKPIYAPDWWMKDLPDHCLDGELWHASDDISYVKSIAGQGADKSMSDERWNTLQYKVFNIWSPKEDYTWRYNYLKIKELDRQYVSCLEQTQITPDYDINKNVLPDTEGLMLVNPYSYYEHKRSRNLLKIKHCLETEAEVVAINPGEGKHKGRMGSIQVKLVWDEKVTSVFGGTSGMIGRPVCFKIGGGFSDEQREKSVPIGAFIRFSYLGVTTNGIPISPNFLEVVCE